MKTRRQSIILELVDRAALHSQEQLRRELRQRGFEATQATISRDIAELGLVKRAGDGAYQRPGVETPNPETALTALERAASEFLRTVDRVQQLVVVRTGPGQAQTLASALDRARLPDVVGTIGGDDTILVITRGARGAGALVKRLKEYCLTDRPTERILLAHGGGRSTSAAIPWLVQTRGAEVVALTLDTGRGRELEDVRDRALADGAVRAHVLDVREEFARAYLLPALKAGALYDDGRSLMAGLFGSLVARTLVEIAAIEQTTTVAHGASTDPRIGEAVRALNPAIVVLVPPVAAGGFPAARGAASRTPVQRAGEAAFVEIAFARGAPTALNGITMPLPDLIASVDVLAGAHGIGRGGGLDTPGAYALHIAHASLQHAASSAAAARFAPLVARAYIDVIDGGSWFTPHREALDAYIERASAAVTGVVRLQLSTGACAIVETRADDSRLETDEHSVVRPLRFRA